MVDSRAVESSSAIRRRRECEGCGQRFTTFERIETSPLVVVKRSGGREPFDPLKIVGGLTAACKGRPVGAAQLQCIADEVEESARLAGGDTSTEWIGSRVLELLREHDTVAAVRFASVYKDFDEPADFVRELGLLPTEVHGRHSAATTPPEPLRPSGSGARRPPD